MQWCRCVQSHDYEVSDTGLVRRATHGKGTWPGRPLKTFPDGFGYPKAKLTIGGMHKSFNVHRLVAMAFLGPPPSLDHEVAHIDGDRTNANASNLRWASHSENELDKRTHGTAPIGERNGAAILTCATVVVIRRSFAAGETIRQIAGAMGIRYSHVWDVLKGKSWKHVA